MNTFARGKNATGELKQVCYSVLTISEDKKVGNNQKSENFWEGVREEYKKHKPAGSESRGKKSLEGKWGDIKHDVAKFIRIYQQVEDLQISGINNEDTLSKAHELYKQNHPKGKAFAYEECFWILRKSRRWGNSQDKMVTSKKRLNNGEIENKNSQETPIQEVDDNEAVHHSSNEGPAAELIVEQKCPKGNKKAKEDFKQQKFDHDALKASMKATDNWEKSNAERNYCTQINTMMRLIMMPTASLTPGMQAYVEQFQLEEAQILRAKIQEGTPRFVKPVQFYEQETPCRPSSLFNAAEMCYVPERIQENTDYNDV